MSETPHSEELDRVRRAIEAGLIRCEKFAADGQLREFHHAIDLIQSLIDTERKKEAAQHAATKRHQGPVHRHRNRKANKPLSGRAFADGEPTGPVAASRDLHAGESERNGCRVDADDAHGRAISDCEDSGSICGDVPERVD